MATETLDAPVAVQEELQMPTPEDIQNMARNRDVKGLKAIQDKLDSKPNPEPIIEEPKQELKQEPAAVIAPAPVEQPKTEPKKFAIRYGGTEEALPDDDGYLGYGSPDKLKLAAAHKERHIKQLEKENQESRRIADEATAKQKAFEQELENLRRQAAERPVQQPASIQTRQDAQIEDVEIGDAPKPPEAEFDPDNMSTDDVAKWNKHFKELSAYNDRLSKAIRSRKATPAPQEIDTLVQSRTENIKSEISELKKQVETFNRERERIQREEAAKRMWLEFDSFQTRNKTLSTPKTLKDLHEDVEKWSDAVAARSGYAVPYNASPEVKAQYFSNRQRLVQRYLNGDPDVIDRVADLQPPDGYDSYYTIAAVNALANEKKLTLDEALAVHHHNTGNMRNDLNNLQLAAEEKARKQYEESLKSAHNHVNPIPNSVAQRAQGSAETQPDEDFVSNVDPRNLFKDREMLKLAKEKAAKMGW